MITEKDINDIQTLLPEEQNLVLSLVRSLKNRTAKPNEAQRWLSDNRKKHLSKNPMTMEEIDRIIHEED